MEYPLFPLGLAYIAAALKEHEVRVFDPCFYDIDAGREKLADILKSFQPDIVGISLRNIDTVMRRDPFVHYRTLAPMVRLIRKTHPEGIIVVGGTAFSLYAQQIMERIGEIDFGVYLEGEETIVELLENIDTPGNVKGIFWRKGGKVCFTGERPPPNFSALPMPRRDKGFIDIRQYVSEKHNSIGLQSKRGCVLNCSYCTYVFLNKQGIRLRRPVHVVDEIELMAGEYGIRAFTFVDNVFNVPAEHAREICRELIGRKVAVEWSAWLTPKGLTHELLLLMEEAGCRRIRFSPDAATDRGLAALAKDCTARDIGKSIRLFSNIKHIFIGYNFFCAYPGMTWSDLAHTIWYLIQISLLYPGRSVVHFNWIRIEPYTGIYQQALEEGMINSSTSLLPETEHELMPLFYNLKRLSRITGIFEFFISFRQQQGIIGRALSAMANRLTSRP